MVKISKERRKRYKCFVCNKDEHKLVRFSDWYSEIEYIICGGCLRTGLDEIRPDKLDIKLPKVG